MYGTKKNFLVSPKNLFNHLEGEWEAKEMFTIYLCFVYQEENISSLITVLVSLSEIILGNSQFSAVQGDHGRAGLV